MALHNLIHNTIASESPAYILNEGLTSSFGVLTIWKAGAFNHTNGVSPVFSNATMTGRLFVMCYRA